MCKKFICLFSFVLLLGLAASNQATAVTVFYDNFDGPNNVDLNGRTPDITNGAVWAAGTWADADGYYGGGSSGQSFTAALPFIRKIGAVYELSATVNNFGNDWLGIAFLNTVPTVSVRLNDNTPYLWSLVRGKLGTGKDQAFAGPGTNNPQGDASTFSASAIKVRVEMISTTKWVVKWYFNGVKEKEATINPTTVGITNQSIYVAFGGNGMFSPCYGTISSFKLEEKAQALDPYPVNNSMIYSTSVTLKWQPGIYAAHHNVYLGGSFADVNNATPSTPGIYKGQQDPNNYPVTGLTPGANYYWRIDEVNGVDIVKGDVWNFRVQPLTAYDPSPPVGAKYLDANVNLSWTAGAKAKFHDVYLDTSFNDVNTATRANHAAVQYYSENQVAITYDPPADLALGTTYYWRIDEVNNPNIWKGDVWSFQIIPTIPVIDPHLVGWWTLDEGVGIRAVDWSGHGHHGTLINGPVWEAGHIDGALRLDGADDQVSLPIGSVVNSLDSATFMTWVNWARVGATVQRIFDFGTGTDNFMFLSPGNGGGGGSMQFNITTPGGATTLTATPLAAGWHHLAVTIDADSGEMIIYLDAVSVASGSTTIIPSDLGNTTSNWLGRSQSGGYLWFIGLLDDFRIYDYALTQEEIGLAMAPPEAWLPNPADGATGVKWNPTLSWNPGKYAAAVNGHKVYFDPNIAKVQARKGCDVNGVSTTPPSYTPSSLEPLTTYYWAIDEVNGSNTWKGNVWRFTTRSVDAFEQYTATGGTPPEAESLRRTWIDGLWAAEWFDYPGGLKTPGSSGSYAQLNTDTSDDATNTANIALGGTKSMKLYYDNDGTITWLPDLYGEDPYYNYTAPKYSEVSAAIDDAARLSSPNPPFDPAAQDSLGIDRDLSGYTLLRVPVYGDPANTLAASEKLYVGLRDGDGTEVTIYNPDPNIIKLLGWQDWYIRLSNFPAQNANLDLTNIARIYIGIGVRGNNAFNGGRGAVFFDDIQLLLTGVCIPGSFAGDFTGDCTVNAADLQRMTELWLGQMPTMPTPVIQLDASGLAIGTLSTWSNTGSAGGSFNDFNSLVPGDNPIVAMVEGKKAVVFDGNDILRATINAPASITGSNPFTIIYNVWNLERGTDEEIFCWAKRGTYARYAAACYASGTAYAAAALWGAADVGFDRGSPAAHTWHTIALTYKGDVNQPFYVVTDGQINTNVIRNLNLWPNNPMTVGGAYNGNPDDVNNPTITGGYFYSGALAKLEVYNVYVPPGNLAILMGTPIDMKKDSVINFRDIAIFAKNWMLGPVLWP
jgi:hypothetical protein